MMCIAERRRRHRQLAERLRLEQSVATIDTLMPAASPSGHLESEILAQTTLYGGVEPAILQAIIDADLTLVETINGNDPDYRLVTVR